MSGYESKRPISTKPRTCLKCNKTFNSTGPGNRICDKCNYRNETIVDRIETTKVITDKSRGKD